MILLVTGRSATPGFAGLAIGLTLTAVHLIGIPLDGTSVNPARSLGPALFAGGSALAHVWLFIVAPLIGAALAFVAVRAITTPLVTEEAAREAEAAAGGRRRPDRRRAAGAEQPCRSRRRRRRATTPASGRRAGADRRAEPETRPGGRGCAAASRRGIVRT